VTESANITKERLKNTPAPSTEVLHANKYGLERHASWNYLSVIGQLNDFTQTHDQTYLLPYINVHNYLKTQKLYTKKQSNK
jgi:hypothetical protein